MVLKHSSMSRMQLPSILCAALSSLSVTPLIFFATDFVGAIEQNLSIEKRVNLLVSKNFSAAF